MKFPIIVVYPRYYVRLLINNSSLTAQLLHSCSAIKTNLTNVVYANDQSSTNAIVPVAEKKSTKDYIEPIGRKKLDWAIRRKFFPTSRDSISRLKFSLCKTRKIFKSLVNLTKPVLHATRLTLTCIDRPRSFSFSSWHRFETLFSLIVFC